jgi:ubiquitin C-terminal hydrolase
LSKGLPFLPDFFYDTLEEFNPLAINFQEDAQEYLSFLLNKAHEELLQGIILYQQL